MERKIEVSRLEIKCRLKTFTETQPNQPKYRNCYNCSGFVRLPCYVEPYRSKQNLDGDGI